MTDASETVGCIEALAFAETPRQVRHRARVLENSVNREAQVIVDLVDDARSTPVPLKAGAFFMHHGLSPHRSVPNRSEGRRIELGLNFIPTLVRTTGG